MSVDKFYLKEVCFNYFLDYLALELNIINDYKFSDYYKLLVTINNDENIKILKNFNNNYDLLDLVCYNYNNDASVKLLYNNDALLAYINNGKFYYHILVTINHKIFKSYKNIPHFVNELEDFIESTYKN